jgi:hypothetical protein
MYKLLLPPSPQQPHSSIKYYTSSFKARPQTLLPLPRIYNLALRKKIGEGGMRREGTADVMPKSTANGRKRRYICL